MTCVPADLRDGARAGGRDRRGRDARSATDAQIRARLEAQHAAFAAVAEAAPVTAADIGRARERSGGAVAAWGSDGACLGAASWVGVRSGVSEIAGVGVLEAHRGRGIAGALTAAAARCAFEAGAELAFLTPGDDGAQRVYARAGFRERVRCVHIARIEARPLSAAPPPFGLEQRPPIDGTDHWVGRKIPALIDACDLPHEDRFIVYLPRTVKDEGEGRGDLGRDTNGCRGGAPHDERRLAGSRSSAR